MRIAGSVSDNAKSERRVLPGRCNGEGAFAPANNLNCCDNDVHPTAQQHEKEAPVIAKLEEEIKDLKDSLKVTMKEKNHLEIRNHELLSIINNLQEKEFTCINLMKGPKNFSYLTGLTIEQFNLIMACVEHYINLIPYPHSKGSGQRSLDTKTELVTVLAICRHSLHFGVIAIVLDKSRVTVQIIFTTWVICLATVFNQVDLRPSGRILLHKMPKVF